MVNKTYFTKYPFTQPPILVTTLLPPHPHNKPVRELRQVCTDEGSDSLPAQEANSSRAGHLLHSVCPRRPFLPHACARHARTPVHALTHSCKAHMSTQAHLLLCMLTLTRHTHSYTLSSPPFHWFLLGYPQQHMLLYTVYRVYHIRVLSALLFNS